MAEREWLEADGLGGFASGTARLTRTRRYHALLLVARHPPADRFVLVNGLEAHLETDAGRFALSDQYYAPGVAHPGGSRYIERFSPDPWPRWLFRLPDGTYVVQELFAIHGAPRVAVSFRLVDATKRARLTVRPLLSGRDYHALHHANDAFDFTPHETAGAVAFRPYGDTVPEILIATNGDYHHAPEWFRNFLYTDEKARGLDHLEDLASPGEFRFALGEQSAYLLLGGGDLEADREKERTRRAEFPSRLHRSADAYVVRRGDGKTIIAGYPWFGDWGRDTFISLRGLATDREKLEILREWSKLVSEGMIPNRFPDSTGGPPEYNSADASLWFIIAAGAIHKNIPREIQIAIDAILDAYTKGTRYGIRADHDGLLAAGVPGVQLTWMDAKVGDWVVTPRIGKPVELEALWINALRIGGRIELAQRATASFLRRFFTPTNDALFDVVDEDDVSFRPNQIFALGGGLPYAIVEGPRARAILDQIEARLYTPLGLRTLAPDDPNYAGRCEGGVRERDGAYHRGTVWPWLLGPFVEAWLKVRGSTEEAKAEARARFVAPLLAHLDEAGLGHVSEIADGDPPHEPRGCPFQAWSLAELLRLVENVLP